MSSNQLNLITNENKSFSPNKPFMTTTEEYLTKVTRLDSKKARLESRARELLKQAKIYELQIDHYKGMLEFLSKDYEPKEISAKADELQDQELSPGVRASNAVVLAIDEKQAKPPARVDKGPACRACGEYGTLYRTNRSMNNGKVVPMAVCDGCKTEQVIFG